MGVFGTVNIPVVIIAITFPKLYDAVGKTRPSIFKLYADNKKYDSGNHFGQSITGSENRFQFPPFQNQMDDHQQKQNDAAPAMDCHDPGRRQVIVNKYKIFLYFGKSDNACSRQHDKGKDHRKNNETFDDVYTLTLPENNPD